MYYVIDGRNGQIVGSAKNRKTAQRKADRLDNQYGAYRYTVMAANLKDPNAKPGFAYQTR